MRRGRAAITGERNAFAQQKAPAGGAGAFQGILLFFVRPAGDQALSITPQTILAISSRSRVLPPL